MSDAEEKEGESDNNNGKVDFVTIAKQKQPPPKLPPRMDLTEKENSTDSTASDEEQNEENVSSVVSEEKNEGLSDAQKETEEIPGEKSEVNDGDNQSPEDSPVSVNEEGKSNSNNNTKVDQEEEAKKVEEESTSLGTESTTNPRVISSPPVPPRTPPVENSHHEEEHFDEEGEEEGELYEEEEYDEEEEEETVNLDPNSQSDSTPTQQTQPTPMESQFMKYIESTYSEAHPSSPSATNDDLSNYEIVASSHPHKSVLKKKKRKKPSADNFTSIQEVSHPLESAPSSSRHTLPPRNHRQRNFKAPRPSERLQEMRKILAKSTRKIIRPFHPLIAKLKDQRSSRPLSMLVDTNKLGSLKQNLLTDLVYLFQQYSPLSEALPFEIRRHTMASFAELAKEQEKRETKRVKKGSKRKSKKKLRPKSQEEKDEGNWKLRTAEISPFYVDGDRETHLLEFYQCQETKSKKLRKNKKRKNKKVAVVKRQRLYRFDLGGESWFERTGLKSVTLHLDRELHASMTDLRMRMSTVMVCNEWCRVLKKVRVRESFLCEKGETGEGKGGDQRKRVLYADLAYFDEWEGGRSTEEFWWRPCQKWNSTELVSFFRHVRVEYNESIGSIYGHLFSDKSLVCDGPSLWRLLKKYPSSDFDDIEDDLEDIGIADDEHLDVLLEELRALVDRDGMFYRVEHVVQGKVMKMFLKMFNNDVGLLRKNKPFHAFRTYCSHFCRRKIMRKTIFHILTKHEKKIFSKELMKRNSKKRRKKKKKKKDESSEEEQSSEEEESESEEEEDNYGKSKIYKVKLIITENLQDRRSKNLRKLLGLPLSFSTKVGLTNIKWGMFHAAITIGPLQLEWVDNSLCLIRSVSSEKVLLCVDVGYVELEDVELFCQRIADECLKWNTDYTYDVLNLKRQKFHANCQQFVEYISCRVLDLPLEFSTDIKNYLAGLRGYGKTKMVFKYNSEFGETFGLREKGPKTFNSHDELDEFVIVLMRRCETFPQSYSPIWELLKGFDRAFWLKYMQVEKNKSKLKKNISARKNKRINTSRNNEEDEIDYDCIYAPSRNGCPFNNYGNVTGLK